MARNSKETHRMMEDRTLSNCLRGLNILGTADTCSGSWNLQRGMDVEYDICYGCMFLILHFRKRKYHFWDNYCQGKVSRVYGVRSKV